MRLEGSLDAFSLPDILQLLAFTQKTGALVLRRPGAEGIVRVRSGAVSGASSDTSRQALGRRLVGAGLIDDDDLTQAITTVSRTPGLGLGRALVDTGAVTEETLKQVASDQATDAVCELLRWQQGDFQFVLDAEDPDRIELTLTVDEVVAEGRRRLEEWPALAAQIPSPATVLAVSLSPAEEPACSRDEWALLALVDGRRAVGEIVNLAGRGEYAVVSGLAALLERGLLVSADDAEGGLAGLLRRQQALSALEGAIAEAPEPVADTALAAPAAPAAPAVPPAPPAPAAPSYSSAPAADPTAGFSFGGVDPSIDPDPALAVDAKSPDPVGASMSGSRGAAGAAADATTTAAGTTSAPAAASSASVGAPVMAGTTTSTTMVGGTEGSAAMAAQTVPVPAGESLADRDSAVTKSLLLRLIAGVRGL